MSLKCKGVSRGEKWRHWSENGVRVRFVPKGCEFRCCELGGCACATSKLGTLAILSGPSSAFSMFFTPHSKARWKQIEFCHHMKSDDACAPV